MQLIKYRFQEHIIHPNSEMLIIGTFNPDTPENDADFFYGRPRNFLWTLLPVAFSDPSLKGNSVTEKKAYILQRKIDFFDLIAEVRVEQPGNYKDSYLDNKITGWTDIVAKTERLPHLSKVCFTRRTFSGIPNMRERIKAINNFCVQNSIAFQYLPTPARFYRADKQE